MKHCRVFLQKKSSNPQPTDYTYYIIVVLPRIILPAFTEFRLPNPQIFSKIFRSKLRTIEKIVIFAGCI